MTALVGHSHKRRDRSGKARAVSHLPSEMMTEDTTLVALVHCQSDCQRTREVRVTVQWGALGSGRLDHYIDGNYDCANEVEGSSPGQTTATSSVQASYPTA